MISPEAKSTTPAIASICPPRRFQLIAPAASVQSAAKANPARIASAIGNRLTKKAAIKPPCPLSRAVPWTSPKLRARMHQHCNEKFPVISRVEDRAVKARWARSRLTDKIPNSAIDRGLNKRQLSGSSGLIRKDRHWAQISFQKVGDVCFLNIAMFRQTR